MIFKKNKPPEPPIDPVLFNAMLEMVGSLKVEVEMQVKISKCLQERVATLERQLDQKIILSQS
ncbi:MAG: hypothetical protein PW734_01415 [Verrucomicrobium sp.]|nr:hypothetical protein [Verrucomicrobium sp.]